MFHASPLDGALASYDGQDILPEDFWITSAISRAHDVDSVQCIVSNDRNWVFVNLRYQWLRLREDDEPGSRNKYSPEVRYRMLRFDRCKKILAFHRGAKEPMLLDRVKDASGPTKAFVDKRGDTYLWYQEHYISHGTLCTREVCVSLDGKRFGAFEEKMDGFPIPGMLDLEQSAWIGVNAFFGRTGPVRSDGRRWSLRIRMVTWKHREDKIKKVAIEIDDIFEERDGIIVSKTKPAIPIQEPQ